MPLSEYETDWITKTSNTPVPELTDAEGNPVETAFEKREERLDFLLGPESELAVSKSDIAQAQEFNLNTQQQKTLWDKIMRRPEGKIVAMKWKASDSDLDYFGHDLRADKEVDTIADVGEDTLEIPEETLNALTNAFDRLMAVSSQMANELNDAGERMFSDADIRRELWAPLVREGTIPENLVPQKFSEHALAFKGAAEIYQDRIDDYSRNSHGKEDLIRGLGIAADTLSVVNTIVGSSVTISNANEMAELNEAILTGKDADNNPVDVDKLKEQRSILQTQEAFATFGGTVLTGGFSLVKSGVEESAKGEDANWAKFADKSIQVLTKVVAAGIGPIATTIVGHDRAAVSDDGKAEMRTVGMVKAAVLGGLSACRMVPTLITVVKAKPGDRRKMVDQMIEQFADAVALGIQAAASKESDNTKKANLMTLSVGLKTLIIASGKSERAIELLVAGKPGEAALLLGGAAFMCEAGGFSGLIVDGVREDSTKDEYNSASTQERLFMENTDDAAYAEKVRADAVAKMQNTVDANIAAASEKIISYVDDTTPTVVDPGQEAFALEAQKQIAEAQQAKVEEELKAQFGDPVEVAKMFAKFDEDMAMVGYDEMYEEATPEASLEGKPPSEVESALEAIDRAIANTSQLRARAEMINGITSAGTAIVASVIPGTGAVVAAQAVAYDIYCLSRAVTTHNKWVDSMEVAFRAGSAYSPAIEKTLTNARITLSHKSVKLVLDSLKLGNEIGRCFDPTGTTTIISSSLTMASALVDYGYKMQKEAEITNGWNAYKKARDNPANRKAARAALRLNSTLAKCCIAYGACMAKDPAAIEAVRISGLSPAVLADDKDVCKRLVSYLENEMNEDPIVMHVERQPKKWQPGKPELTPSSWFETKTAAVISASPRLDAASAKTPGMDRLIAELSTTWEGHRSYREWRNARDTTPDEIEERRLVARPSVRLLNTIATQMASYAPRQEGSSEVHAEMADIAQTYRALALLNLPLAEKDLNAPPIPSRDGRPALSPIPEEDEEEEESIEV